MISHTGWTWAEVENEMDLHRYAAMQRHQRRFPPLQAMVQAWMGIEPTAPAEDETPAAPLTPEQEEAAIADFVANFAAAGGTVH